MVLAARIFLGLQGLVALGIGVLCALLNDWSALGVTAEGAGRIELKVAIGGTWVFLGVMFLRGAFAQGLRPWIGQVALLYSILGLLRILAMQGDSATMNTLIFLAYEAASALIALALFFRLNPDRRRIFGG